MNEKIELDTINQQIWTVSLFIESSFNVNNTDIIIIIELIC